MSNTPAETRFTLRSLPLPAKLVVTCFLLAVGLGYTAAMVQLHFQDSKSGKAMPTVSDVVLKFTGKKFFETEPPRPTSKFVKLLLAPAGEPFNGAGTMFPAFTTRDDGEFMKEVRAVGDRRSELLPQREGERDALVLWAESPPDVRKKAYDDDHFGIEPGKGPKVITKEFKSDDGAIKVKSIIETRCARCHKKGEPQENYPLEKFSQIEKYLVVPATIQVKPGGDWVRVEEPMGLEKLTQSTHAHLLSFAVLFSLTGLVFAFTSYPTPVRCILGPWVLVAIVTDVIFWWVARLSETYGVYFAMGVMGTGAAVGMGLSAQILLSLWNMYGAKGKAVLLLLFALAGAAGTLVALNVVKPGLDAKQAAKAEANNPPDANANGDGGKVDTPPKKQEAKNGGNKVDNTPGPNRVQTMLQWPVKGPDGKELAVRELKFKKDQVGGMVRAFFDKDKAEFAQAIKDEDADAQSKLTPERHAELAALTAWAGLPAPEQKRTYDADAFDLPTSLAGKPITKDFVAGGKVKVKTMLETRCFGCHAGEADDLQFDNLDGLRKFLEPAKPAGK